MDSTTKRTLLQRASSHRLLTTFALLGTLSAGILIGSTMTASVSGKEQVNSSDARPLTIPSPVALSNSFSTIVKQVGPAVVNISTESLPKPAAARTPRKGQRGQAVPKGDDDQQGDMQDFFNKFFGGQNPNGGDDEGSNSERKALGSGYIVDSRGYIITNNHVVDKADRIYVKLSTDPDTGSTDLGRPAKVVGVDPETDIAVIKIESSTPLPTVKLGNSDGSQVGDWVLAIGSPFGLSQTVSAGIVSAKNRSIDEPSPDRVSHTQFQRFIQTDAAINPGNSGGPLVDMTGAVIGMNTAIYTQSMGSQGVGFAMPSNIVAKVYNMLISPEHKVTRGSIGIQFQAATSSAVGRIYGQGVYISTVTPRLPADRAGLKPEDVIVSLDGRNIKDGNDMVDDISNRKVGSTVKIGFLRDGKKMTADVQIADRADAVKAAMGSGDDSSDDKATPQESDAGQNKLGITVTAIPASVAKRMGVPGGVAVSSVKPGSFADEVGLGRGAVIVAINRKPVTDEASYRAIVNALKPGDDVVFGVRDPQGTPGTNLVGGTLP